MNDKLYPPIIEGTIPAFYGTTLVVPFSMNRATSRKSYKGFQLKLKKVQGITNDWPTFYANRNKDDNFNDDDSNFVKFDLSKIIDDLHVGQYYKIQIAYVNKEDIIGYYSTVATVKYTSEPQVKIAGLSESIGDVNPHTYNYIGTYSQFGENKDPSEKVYSYRFDFFDGNNKLLKTSGDQIHNSSTDTELYSSQDFFSIDQDLNLNTIYYLQYTIMTNNKLEVHSHKYAICQQKTINPEAKVELLTDLNFENGYIDLSLKGHKGPTGIEDPVTGSFKILRSDEEDGFSTWNEILRFSLYGQQPSRKLWRDHTVKQGVHYKYALQQYNESQLTSNKIESKIIYSDFEHAFLFDGDKQLKIKYNPKVSSFKNTLLESKVDTIGNKHPFIFRNGNVNYKEFPISGLISYQSDEDFLFMDTLNKVEEPLNRKSQLLWATKDKDSIIFEDNFDLNNEFFDDDQKANFSIDLTNGNITTERNFKLEVLNWLTNGKPKLFRSPTEGNYIVRLLNVSLSPIDSLGRMLHSFNCSAYEVAEYSHKNLVEFNFLKIEDPTIKQLRWETIEFNKDGTVMENNLLRYPAVSLAFEGMIPGDQIYIEYKTDKNDKDFQNYIATVGVTGTYNIDLNNNLIITQVKLTTSIDNPTVANKIVHHQGSLTYGYYSKTQNKFDIISDIEIINTPLEQFIGRHDVLTELEDVRTEVQNIYYLHFILRDLLPLYEYVNYGDNYKNYYNKLMIIERFEQMYFFIMDIENKRFDEITNALELYPELNEFFTISIEKNHYIYDKDAIMTFLNDLGFELEVDKKDSIIQLINQNGQLFIDMSKMDSIYYFNREDGVLIIVDEAFILYRNYATIYSSDASGNLIVEPEDYIIYELQNVTENKYLDGHTHERYNTYEPWFYVNSDYMNLRLDDTLEYSIRNPKDINVIRTGNAIICEMTYQKQILSYMFEDEDNFYSDIEAITAKEQYEQSYNTLYNLIYKQKATEEEILIAEQNCNTLYKIYIDIIDKKLKERKEWQSDAI